MELEITWGRTLRVWWAYCWRSLIAIVVAFILGAFIGGIIGFIVAMIGLPQEIINFVGLPIGVMIGLAASIVPMKLILGKDFGEFHLVLLSKANNINT